MKEMWNYVEENKIKSIKNMRKCVEENKKRSREKKI